MRPNVVLLATCLQLCQAQNILSGATLFVGGKSPVITTSYGKFQGKNDDPTRTSNYLGISYASAPRFDHSVINDRPFAEIQDVSDYGPSCPQQEFVSFLAPLGLGSISGLVEAALGSSVLKQSEDCLSINIQRPQNISAGEKLPVLMWIHGGGFQTGASSSVISEQSAVPGVFYQGANIVQRSLEMGQPIIFTSINYRLCHLGFSASKEMEDAGLLNLGLEDQRNAMRWVKKHIEAFGGDPEKVTIMGESAGSWSVTGHLVANNGDNEGLFRGAVGISGGGVKVDGPERQQSLFNDLANFVGCGSLIGMAKIDCLREAPYENIYAHTQTVGYFLGYRSAASPWTLRPDGTFLTKSPDKLIAEGNIANVPIMYGDLKDEGTLFSLVNSLNTTTDEDVIDYFKTYWWPNVTQNQLQKLLDLYPNEGSSSPVGIGPQFQRISGIIGDYSLHSQRRQLLDKVTAPKWNYLTEQEVPLSVLGGTPIGSILGETGLTSIPVLGSFHASDVILNWFGTLPAAVSRNSMHLMSVLVAFTRNLDPNTAGLKDVPEWPQYDSARRQTMNWKEEGSVTIISDDFREEGMEWMNENADSLRL